MSDSPQHEFESLLARGMFELAPFSMAVIDRNLEVVAANPKFEESFGEWRGRRCHQVFKSSDQPCAECQAQAAFEDGRPRDSDETGIDRHGRARHYVVHQAPLAGGEGPVRYVMETFTDLTESQRSQRHFDLIFERVPCYVLVVDREFRIVRANEKFRESFGEIEGKHCYELCKRRTSPCPSCPAALTFQDASEHVSTQQGVHHDGSPAEYVVTTCPLSRGRRGNVAHVIEMAADITQIRELEDRLQQAQDFYHSLVRNSATGILALGKTGRVRIMNPAARALLNWHGPKSPSPARLRKMLPEEFFEEASNGWTLNLPEATLRAADGEEVPVRFAAVKLKSRGKPIGRAAFFQDLREIKQLERDKLEAERLGAVGQTVAGLAHTIKNLLMGLEGGMYMVDSGLHRADAKRITEGWEILQRNFEKTTVLVKDFLSFAKGRLPELQPEDPNGIARGVVELYRDAAARQSVELVFEPGAEVAGAPLDAHGIETCLTNLVSNGIDAAVLREQPGGRVVVRTRERGGDLVFEVIDNGCGMDQEVRSKVFTTFFTTKGGKGTGLGLLTTRKIVQEHGGRLETESPADGGSVFRIRLPRRRLETLAATIKTNG